MDSIQWGDVLKQNDIVEIFLDLKENNKLSFAVNGKKYAQCFKLTDNTYKLAIGLYDGKVSLISFEITY